MIIATLGAGYRMPRFRPMSGARRRLLQDLAGQPVTWVAYGWRLLEALCRRKSSGQPPA